MTVTPADYLRRITAIHRELGIPEDYARQRGLVLYEETLELVAAGKDLFGRPRQLAPQALLGWQAMRQAAAEEGVVLHLVSAFRSADYQAGMIRRKLDNGDSLDDILRVTAAPGYSEHHTGRAIDIGTNDSPALEEVFETTDAFHWLNRHAGNFGFVLSYPRNNPSAIAYEPWHWCYRQG